MSFHSIDRLFCNDVVYEAENYCPGFDEVVLITNVNGASNGDRQCVGGDVDTTCRVTRHQNFPDMVTHELGHSFAGINDDYPEAGFVCDDGNCCAIERGCPAPPPDCGDPVEEGPECFDFNASCVVGCKNNEYYRYQASCIMCGSHTSDIFCPWCQN